MNRAEILDNAKSCVCGKREQDYGKPEDNFSTIGFLWTDYIIAAHPELKTSYDSMTTENGAMFSPKDVAVMMALLKVARIATGDNPDSFVDLAGYAACAGEIATRDQS